MKTLHLALLAIAVAALTILFTSNLFIGSNLPDNLVDVREVEYYFEVVDTAGIDVGTDKLRLGGVSPGTTSRRGVEISGADADKVVALVKGEGSEMITVENNNIDVPEGNFTLYFKTNVPEGTEKGGYEGVVTFYFYNVTS